jgi:hypothetical protein
MNRVNPRLPRVPTDAPAIIRKTWDQYRANNGNGMVNSIDQVLRRSEYNTTLATEFPKFTWNNYFMITGTYDIQVTGVYTNLATLPPTFTGPEWQLFRSWLQYPRNDWNGSDPRSNGIANAGVAIIDQVVQFPVIGPPVDKPNEIDSLGAAYIEFYPTNLPSGITADLNVTITIPSGALLPATDRPKVSVIAISNFGATPNPPNDFVQPTTQVGSLNLFYNRQVVNFKTSGTVNRVVVIISNISPTLGNVPYMYSANIVIR